MDEKRQVRVPWLAWFAQNRRGKFKVRKFTCGVWGDVARFYVVPGTIEGLVVDEVVRDVVAFLYKARLVDEFMSAWGVVNVVCQPVGETRKCLSLSLLMDYCRDFVGVSVLRGGGIVSVWCCCEVFSMRGQCEHESFALFGWMEIWP